MSDLVNLQLAYLKRFHQGGNSTLEKRERNVKRDDLGKRLGKLRLAIFFLSLQIQS